MAPLMFPIHLISELSRLISLSMRLFGNVFAGEVLLATMLALTYLVVPAVFLGLEAVFGFVQALVFSLLAMTYITLAIAEHHAGGHGHEGEDPDNPNVERHPADAASVQG
jgi:F-type H+-transporting ATPase subunit a